MESMNRKWSTSCLELISVRLEHLDKKYSTILERYELNHQNIAGRLEQIKTDVSQLESDMEMNNKVNSVYDGLSSQFDGDIVTIKTEAQNWISGMTMALDLHARQQLEKISFDECVKHEQRDIAMLEAMVDKLRHLHGNVLEGLAYTVEKRQKAEREIIENISEETKKLLIEKKSYESNKCKIKSELSTLIGALEKQIISEVDTMKHARDEFEDFVLDTLEQQMTAFATSKFSPLRN
ncbi:uncharacterized protein BBOV_IV007125 [Babesia bovis T2Bo]|uniref:SF-assemblin n=1 Tax=Babesia bovis TaxID=5865 RepID=S6C932_BABBO|nr:uncharacterized protein BBOV_IV007125 [Babesia bovis T2Bo]KAG6439979.1 hypothetical protein BBOV_IV007125 [Babesia bovis T2Bo]BAN65175.1 hypothetical protein [Babesia bovis]